MGRPSQIKPRRQGANRRDFLRRSGSAALALGALPALAVGADATPAAGRARSLFQHGVASGDPLADRVILWTRVSPLAAASTVVVEWEMATDPGFGRVLRRGRVNTDASRDFTVKTDATGLSPATTYYYRFSAQGLTSPIGRTRTLPTGHAERLRMAVVSCSNHAYGYFNAYRRVAERADLDLVVHLGDYLYEYGSGVYGSLRATEPPTEILTLPDYRQRHAQYKRDADLQELHRQHPMVAIWDDHEIANDAFQAGAENHTEGAEGRWADRVAAGLKAYYEWMPVRVVDSADLRRNYRRFRFGNLVDLIMLEERLGARSQQLPAAVPTPLGNAFVQAGAFTDPARTLLGSEQEAWLASQLRGSGTRWKFIGQGVMFAQLKGVAATNAAGGGAFFNPDQWDGYQPARDRLYAVLKGDDAQPPPVDNVVVLTGDIHSSWAADLTQDPNNPDLATGGYDAASGAGSKAVEFVATSVTSPGLDDPDSGIAGFLRSVNPHFKYIDLNRRGYMLLDANPERVVCEWWYVDTVASISNVQTFGTAFEVRAGSNRLAPSAQTPSLPGAAPLAP